MTKYLCHLITKWDKIGWMGRAGQGRAGQGRAGQGRAGQGRAGQGRAGQGIKFNPRFLRFFQVLSKAVKHTSLYISNIITTCKSFTWPTIALLCPGCPKPIPEKDGWSGQALKNGTKACTDVNNINFESQAMFWNWLFGWKYKKMLK